MATNVHISSQISTAVGNPPFDSTPPRYDETGFNVDHDGWQVPPDSIQYEGFVAQNVPQNRPSSHTPTYPPSPPTPTQDARPSSSKGKLVKWKNKYSSPPSPISPTTAPAPWPDAGVIRMVFSLTPNANNQEEYRRRPTLANGKVYCAYAQLDCGAVYPGY